MSPALAYILFGTPFVGAGGWLIRGLKKQHRKETQEYLHAIFYRLLQKTNGNITVFRFAMEAKLSAEAAQQYLDEKAKEFDADFSVDEEGGIFYCFPMSGIKPQALPAVIPPKKITEETYVVMLESIPADKKFDIIRELQLITAWDFKEVKQFVETIPNFFLGVNKTKAEAIKRQLEKAGAKVSLR